MQPTEIVRFQTCVLELTQLLLDVVEGFTEPLDSSLLHLAKAGVGVCDKRDLIERFIEHSHRVWEKVRVKDSDFFITHAGSLFSSLGDVDMFLRLYQTKDSRGQRLIDPELEETLWSFFHAMVKISLKYVHKERASRECFPELDLSQTSLWGVTL